MTTPLIAKTKDIKYTMTQYEYDSEFLKSVGVCHAANPNTFVGVIMSGKYRSPPARVVKEDGKKTWRAQPVQDQVFMNILNMSGRAGNWIITYGGPKKSETHMPTITSENKWIVEDFELYNSPLGLVALVTQVDSE